MNKKYIENFKIAGELAKQVRNFGKSLIKKGSSYNHVIEQINVKILELGAKPAFPPQIALNHVAAHYLPAPHEDIIFADQVVKLDVGVCYNGAIGDCAVTIDLSGNYQNLIDAAEAALLAAEKAIQPGIRISEIGKIIESTIASYKLSPIKNLSGHSLGYYKVHTAPTIPNYDDRSRAILTAGMSFAIEPFATNGRGFIHEFGDAMIFSLIKEQKVKTEVSRFLLKKIRSYNGLPFAIHSFCDGTFSYEEIKNTLNEFTQQEIIASYPPLIEDVSCMVAQAENSVLIDLDGSVIVTTR